MAKFYKPKFSVDPEAEYHVTVMQAEEGRSKAGNEIITLTLGNQSTGEEFQERVVFHENCAWKIAEILEAFGVAYEDGDDITPNSFMGRTAKVRLGTEEFAGRTRIKVKEWLLPKATAREAAPVNPARLAPVSTLQTPDGN